MKIWIFWLALLAAAPLQALDRTRAETLALQSDPALSALAERARAFELDAVAVHQLPDPELMLGAMSVPLPDLDVRSEPMTQFQAGIRQRVPAKALRQARASLENTRADQLRAAQVLRELEVKRRMRQLWVSAYYLQELLDSEQQSLAWLEELTDSRVRGLESARVEQSVVLTSRSLEARLARQITEKRNDLYQVRAELIELLQIDVLPPALPLDPLTVPTAIAVDEHPAIVLAGMGIAEAEAGIDVAQAAFKPGWSIQAGIGQRIGNEPFGAPSDTLLNAQLTIDLPLFTRNRQSKRLSAARARHTAASSETVRVLRQLRSEISAAQAQLSEFDALINTYTQQALPASRESAEALRDRYERGRADLEDVIEAELEVTDIEQEWLQTRRARDLVTVELNYLGGQ